MSFRRQAAALHRQVAIAPFIDRLRELAPESTDQDLWASVIDEAARVAEDVIDPLDRRLDEAGCRLENGRVRTAERHKAAWDQFRELGWIGLALPERLGGQGLPLVLLTACEELFNRGSPAFTMLVTPNRTAAVLLDKVAEPQVRDAWVPKLLSGDWAATICISEPDAGSDVGRIRTVARQDDEGRWRISGEKCWISYGDHDLAGRIGHFMLARTSDAPGVRGLSLFLTPNTRDDGAANGVFVRRIEEKMGLHGSPTCVLGFEEAEGVLLGEPERGLQQLFNMMLLMRLSCGPQGVGVAAGAAEAALDYAYDRKQGGAPTAPPIAIVQHADVQRQLLSLHARVETARGLQLAAAAAMDLAALEPEAEARERWSNLAQWLLPIVKDLGARTGLSVAEDAIQVFGGAGYTREWPIEQAMRDARVFPIFEGTTGIQAIDMLHRRVWRDGGAGLRLFIEAARADAAAGGEAAAQLSALLDRLEATTAALAGLQASPREGEAGAVHYLNLCMLAASGWIAARLVQQGGDDAVGRRLSAAGRFHLAEAQAKADAEAALALAGARRLESFGDLVFEA